MVNAIKLHIIVVFIGV